MSNDHTGQVSRHDRMKRRRLDQSSIEGIHIQIADEDSSCVPDIILHSPYVFSDKSRPLGAPELTTPDMANRDGRQRLGH